MRFRSLFSLPVVAAALSFLFPGLGQAAAGYPRRGAIVAIPFLAFLGSLLVVVLFSRGAILDSAFNQGWLTSLLLLDLVMLIYHVWAVVDAYLLARIIVLPGRNRAGAGAAPAGARRRATSAGKWGATFGVVVIVSGTLAVHGAFAVMDVSWQNASGCLNALIPCWAQSQSTLAPGETIAMTSDNPDDAQIDPTGSAGGSGSSATPTPGPTFDVNALPSFATTTDSENWAADGQLNILLAGIDAGQGGGRNLGLRPDTMMVLHVDINSGKAALIGIPRNTMCVPLPQGIAQHYAKPANGCPAYTWPYMLNWLANEAGWNHPGNFPYPQGADYAYMRAMTATAQAIGTLTGLTIDGYAVINLEGLVNLVDSLGGIDINVPTTVSDYPCGPMGTWAAKWKICDINSSAPAGSAAKIHSGYAMPAGSLTVVAHMQADAAGSGGKQSLTWHNAGGSDIAFTILAGQQHMDGDWALAYARTRIFTSDYDRMMRQQLVLKSLRTSLDPCKVLLRVPSLVNSLGNAFWTNMPLNDASKWAGLAKYIVGGNVKSITLDPSVTGSTYINSASWAKVKDLVSHSLDNVPAAGSGSGSGGGGGFSC